MQHTLSFSFYTEFLSASSKWKKRNAKLKLPFLVHDNGDIVAQCSHAFANGPTTSTLRTFRSQWIIAIIERFFRLLLATDCKSFQISSSSKILNINWMKWRNKKTKNIKHKENGILMKIMKNCSLNFVRLRQRWTVNFHNKHFNGCWVLNMTETESAQFYRWATEGKFWLCVQYLAHSVSLQIAQ